MGKLKIRIDQLNLGEHDKNDGKRSFDHLDVVGVELGSCVRTGGRGGLLTRVGVGATLFMGVCVGVELIKKVGVDVGLNTRVGVSVRLFERVGVGVRLLLRTGVDVGLFTKVGEGVVGTGTAVKYTPVILKPEVVGSVSRACISTL